MPIRNFSGHITPLDYAAALASAGNHFLIYDLDVATLGHCENLIEVLAVQFRIPFIQGDVVSPRFEGINIVGTYLLGSFFEVIKGGNRNPPATSTRKRRRCVLYDKKGKGHHPQ